MPAEVYKSSFDHLEDMTVLVAVTAVTEEQVSLLVGHTQGLVVEHTWGNLVAHPTVVALSVDVAMLVAAAAVVVGVVVDQGNLAYTFSTKINNI